MFGIVFYVTCKPPPTCFGLSLMLKRHDLDGTSGHAFSTLDTIGMQISHGHSTAIVRRKLHGAHPGTALTLHLTALTDVDIHETLGQLRLSGRTPRRQRAHRTERTPRTRRIDKRQNDAYHRGRKDDIPKHLAHGAQITPRKIHLHSKHHEDKHHHEQPETKRAQELGNRLMRRILGQQAVVHITSRAGRSEERRVGKECRSRWSQYH